MKNRVKHKEKKGIILLTVLMMIIVVSILAVSILNMNLGQVISSEEQAKQLKAVILAKGMLNYVYANQQSATPLNVITLTEILDSVTFTTTATLDNTNTGINETNLLNIDTGY